MFINGEMQKKMLSLLFFNGIKDSREFLKQRFSANFASLSNQRVNFIRFILFPGFFAFKQLDLIELFH